MVFVSFVVFGLVRVAGVSFPMIVSALLIGIRVNRKGGNADCGQHSGRQEG